MRRRGILTMSPEELMSALGIPEVTFAGLRYRLFETGMIEIEIEHPSIPFCPDGAYPLLVRLQELKDYGKT